MHPPKNLLIQSGLHRKLKGKPTTASGEDSARLPLPSVKILQDLRFLSLLYDISSMKNKGLEYWIKIHVHMLRLA